jgi:hypothetical protein
MGSGKTAYLDHEPKIGSMLCLAWEDNNGKVFIKPEGEMTASELFQFNPFILSDTYILVVNTESRITYTSVLPPCQTLDPSWTYKVVSVDAILGYITKRLMMGELDHRATFEQFAHDELEQTQDRLRFQTQKVAWLDEQMDCLQRRISELETTHANLTRLLLKSAGLYRLLRHLPAKLRPKAFDGFMEAMKSL